MRQLSNSTNCDTEQLHVTWFYFNSSSLLFSLLMQDCQLLRSSANTLHDFCRSLGQKLFVPQLTLAVADFFLDLIQFLLQSFALGGNVDLSFINHVHVETRRVPCSRQLGQRFSTNSIFSTPASRSTAP